MVSLAFAVGCGGLGGTVAGDLGDGLRWDSVPWKSRISKGTGTPSVVLLKREFRGI